MPSDNGPPRWRASLLLLGVAGIVVATVFAVVASLAVRPAAQVSPFPELPGPVIADSSTTSTAAPTVTTSPVPASTAAVIASSTQPTTTTTRKTTSRTTTTRTTTQAPPPPPPPNQAPTANFTFSCSGTNCDFDGSSSSDQDGTVVYWNWRFVHNNTTEEGVHVQHGFGAPGQYTVILIVMDDKGKFSTPTSKQVRINAG